MLRSLEMCAEKAKQPQLPPSWVYFHLEKKDYLLRLINLFQIRLRAEPALNQPICPSLNVWLALNDSSVPLLW